MSRGKLIVLEGLDPLSPRSEIVNILKVSSA